MGRTFHHTMTVQHSLQKDPHVAHSTHTLCPHTSCAVNSCHRVRLGECTYKFIMLVMAAHSRGSVPLRSLFRRSLQVGICMACASEV
jgi:hypothetical protein